MGTHLLFCMLFYTGMKLGKFDILVYLLTAIGLTPCGSSTVHIYTQTIHRTTKLTQTLYRTTQLTQTVHRAKQHKQYIEQHNTNNT